MNYFRWPSRDASELTHYAQMKKADIRKYVYDFPNFLCETTSRTPRRKAQCGPTTIAVAHTMNRNSGNAERQRISHGE